jgi:hypothetical protein
VRSMTARMTIFMLLIQSGFTGAFIVTRSHRPDDKPRPLP